MRTSTSATRCSRSGAAARRCRISSARSSSSRRGTSRRRRSSRRRSARSQPLCVLPLVVAAELAGLDRLPPAAVRAVPLDGLAHSLPEVARRPPAELLELPGAERVTPVVAGAVLDVAQQRAVRARQLEDELDHLDVLVLVAAADVVGLAGLPLAQHELDPGAMVLDVEPVADLPAVAVDRERLAVERVRHEERDQLL